MTFSPSLPRLALVALPALGCRSAPVVEAPQDGDPPALEHESTLEVRALSYLHDRGDFETEDDQLILDWEGRFGFRPAPEIRALLHPRASVDALNEHYRRFEPYEAYVDYEGDAFGLKLGQFIEAWKFTGVTNPLSTLNRRDFASDLLDADRLGELGGRFTAKVDDGDWLSDLRLALYVIPVFQRTELPAEDSRLDPSVPGFDYSPDTGPEPSGSERVYTALRLTATTRGSWPADLQFVASQGRELLPQVLGPPNPVFEPAYYGLRTLGMGFRTHPWPRAGFLRALTWAGEVAYKDPYRFDETPPGELESYVQWVFGLRWRASDLLRDGDRLLLVLEHAGERGADDPTAERRVFRNDLAPYLVWHPGDEGRSEWILRGDIDLETSERVGMLRYERDLGSSFRIHARLQVYSQAAPSLLSLFNDPSYAELGVSFAF